MNTVALNLVELWTQWVGPILQFLIGLGVVVFVHEFGHLIAAKAVGIKVERFAIGFGPRLFGIKRGETDYCACLLPLGGYIKMLGQEDFGALKDEDRIDPRSFEAKSIGQRMIVISAGVVMNVILGAVLFVIVGMVGKNFIKPVVGYVVPTYPAAKVEINWQAMNPTDQPSETPDFGPGLRGGDLVMSLDGKTVSRFQDLQMRAVLTFNPETTYEILVKRQDEQGREWIGKGNIGVQRDSSGQMLVFGIGMPVDTTIKAFSRKHVNVPFEPGDRVVAIGDQPISRHYQIAWAEKKLDGRPVTVTVLREGQNQEVSVQPTIQLEPSVRWLKDGSRLRGYVVGAKEGENKEKLAVFEPLDGNTIDIAEDRFVPAGLMDILGMTPRLKVLTVSPDSPAQKAGIVPGDVIAGYGDRQWPTLYEFHQISKNVAGQETPIVILRGQKQLTLKVRPKQRKESVQIGFTPAVDLMIAAIAGIRENSPAQKLGLMSGDVIVKINDQPVSTWIDVLQSLKAAAGGKVEIAYRRGVQENVAVVDELSGEIFDPADYRISVFEPELFTPLDFKFVERNPLRAMVWGAGETGNFIVSTYATLRGLVIRTLSPKTLMGPVGIGRLAIRLGRERSLIDFVYFMAFISATLAVINFLPLPVVDGGLAVLLLIEKIRRKPLPTKVMNIIQLVGLGLILLAFVLLTWQDIARWWSTSW